MNMADRVLIVDDEADMTSLLAFNFSRSGFAVSTARDGNEAFEKARMFLPDVIVMDVRMPAMDGIAVCGMLRNVPATRHIPVLIMTGQPTEQTRKQSERAGATDFMQKPFSPRDMISRVRAALSRDGEEEN
jgi:DNA-binding response OmpR family regulator